jgi:hypothetical protein
MKGSTMPTESPVARKAANTAARAAASSIRFFAPPIGMGVANRLTAAKPASAAASISVRASRSTS